MGTARLLALGAFGGGITALVVWAVASRALDAQLRQGATQLSFGLQQGRGELDQRLQQGRTLLANQIRTEVAAQVPPVVRTELEATLRRYNITPTTGAQLSNVLNAASRIGLV